jgi:hypothetical protein
MSITVILGIILGLISVGGTVVSITTRFNHVSHLTADILDLKNSTKENSDKLDKHGEDIAAMKATCEAHHGGK